MSRSYSAFCHLAAKLKGIDNREPARSDQKPFKSFILKCFFCVALAIFKRTVLTNLSLLRSKARISATLYFNFVVTPRNFIIANSCSSKLRISEKAVSQTVSFDTQNRRSSVFRSFKGNFNFD